MLPWLLTTLQSWCPWAHSAFHLVLNLSWRMTVWEPRDVSVGFNTDSFLKCSQPIGGKLVSFSLTCGLWWVVSQMSCDGTDVLVWSCTCSSSAHLALQRSQAPKHRENRLMVNAASAAHIPLLHAAPPPHRGPAAGTCSILIFVHLFYQILFFIYATAAHSYMLLRLCSALGCNCLFLHFHCISYPLLSLF